MSQIQDTTGFVTDVLVDPSDSHLFINVLYAATFVLGYQNWVTATETVAPAVENTYCIILTEHICLTLHLYSHIISELNLFAFISLIRLVPYMTVSGFQYCWLITLCYVWFRTRLSQSGTHFSPILHYLMPWTGCISWIPNFQL